MKLGILIKKVFYVTLFLSLGLILSLSLFSYSSHDLTFWHDSSEIIKTNNLLGAFGANLAALLFYLFGFSAVLLIFYCLLLATVFAGLYNFEKDWDKFLGLGLLVFSISALSNIIGLEFFKNVNPGGLVGFLFVKQFEFKDPIYLYLSLGALLNISLILIFRFAWVKVIFTGFRYFKNSRVLSYFKNIVHNIISDIKETYKYGWDFSFTIFNRYYLKSIEDYKTINPEIINEINSHLSTQLYSNLESNKALNLDDFFVGNKLNNIRQDDIENLQHLSQNLSINSLGSSLSDNLDSNLNSSLNNNSQDNLDIENLTLKDLNLENNSNNADILFQSEVVQESKKEYILPDINLFEVDKKNSYFKESYIDKESEKRANALQEKLECFGIKGKVKSVTVGPVVTLFEYQPTIDTKISNILARENDLALALQAISLRIIAPIPGKSVVGFEVANSTRKPVLFAQGIISQEFTDFKGKLPILLGKCTVGNDFIMDLATTPHLLVAGSTGSGKSVALNTMLMSLLLKLKPDQLKLILIDPKRLEFAPYAHISHLMFPIISDVQEAVAALHYVVDLMDERYATMAQAGVRNIDEYNNKFNNKLHDNDLEPMPYVVVVIDELADLMIKSGRDVEYLIVRISQMARAAGIHMIVATQRPSVDVVTGLIKVNFPSRIAFKVTTKIDSRTILDCMGADKLLGKGDMLYLDSQGNLKRLHGFYASNTEINNLVNYIKSQQAPDYQDLELNLPSNSSNSFAGSSINGFISDESLYSHALDFIKTRDEISISLLQRQFKIGYNKSARLMELLESKGHIAPQTTGKMRKVIH